MVASVVVGGCGSSDGSAGDGTANENGDGTDIAVTTGSLSKGAFIQRVDKLCLVAKERVEGQYGAYLVKESEKSQGESAQARTKVVEYLVSAIVTPTYGKLIDQINSLGAPSGEEEQVASFLNALQEGLDHAAEDPSTAFETAPGTPFLKAAKSATRYGLEGCANSLA